MSGDIKLNVGSDLVRSLRCNDLTTGKKFTLLLGSDKYTIVFHTQFRIASACQDKTDGGFAILINQLPICDYGKDVISCSRPIDMDDHLIKNAKNPFNNLEAVNKDYADRIKYKTVTSNIPNTFMTDHILFTFPAAKAFASGKIK